VAQARQDLQVLTASIGHKPDCKQYGNTECLLYAMLHKKRFLVGLHKNVPSVGGLCQAHEGN